MKNEKEIKRLVSELNEITFKWLDFVNSANEDAYTDRCLENIISLSKKLEMLETERWDRNIPSNTNIDEAKFILNKEIEQAAEYQIAGDCTMYETEGQYQAYIEGLEFALETLMPKQN